MESIIEEFLFEPIRRILSNATNNDPWRREVLRSVIWNVESFVQHSVNKERQNLEKISKGTSTDDMQTDSDQSESTTSSELYEELVRQLEEIRAEDLRIERPNEEVEELKRYIDKLAEKCDTLVMANENLTKELSMEKYMRQENDTSYDMLKEEFVRITSALKEIHLKEFTNMHKVHEQDVNNIENKLWEEFESSIDKMKVEHQIEVASLNAEHVREIENKESIRHQELKDMETTLRGEFECSLENIKLEYEMKVTTLEETYWNEIEHLKINKQKDIVDNPYSCSKKQMINYEAEIDYLTKELKQLKTEMRNETEEKNLVSSEMLDDFIGICCKQFQLTDDLKRKSIIHKNEHQNLSMKFGQERRKLENEIKNLQERTKILTNEIHFMKVKLREKEESFTREILDRNAKELELKDMIKIKDVMIRTCEEEKQEDISELNAKLDEYKIKISTVENENITLKVELMITNKILNDEMTDFMLEIGRHKKHSTMLRDNMNKLKDFSSQQVQYDKQLLDLGNRLICMEVQNKSLTETNLALIKELREVKETLNIVKSEKLQNENRFIEEQTMVQDELEKERKNSLHMQLKLEDNMKKKNSQEEYLKQRENEKLLAAFQENSDMFRMKEENIIEDLRLKFDTLNSELGRYHTKSAEVQSRLVITNNELKRECSESENWKLQLQCLNDELKDEQTKSEKLVSQMESLINKLEKVSRESDNLKKQLECSNTELKSEKSKTANLKSQLESVTNEQNRTCTELVNVRLQVEKFNNKVNIERKKLAKHKSQLENLNNELTRERSNSENLQFQMERLQHELDIEGKKSVELQSLWQCSKNELKIEVRHRAELELRLEDLQDELEKEQIEHKNMQAQLIRMETSLQDNVNIKKELNCVHEEFSKLKQDIFEEKQLLTANIKLHKDKIELKDNEITKLKKETCSLTLHCQNLKQELDLIVNEKKGVDGKWDGLNAQVRNLMNDLELVMNLASHAGSGDGLNKTINKNNGKAMRARSLEIVQANKKANHNEVDQFFQKKMVQPQLESLKSSLSNETNSQRTSYNKFLLSPIREMSESGSSPDRGYLRSRRSQSSQPGKS